MPLIPLCRYVSSVAGMANVPCEVSDGMDMWSAGNKFTEQLVAKMKAGEPFRMAKMLTGQDVGNIADIFAISCVWRCVCTCAVLPLHRCLHAAHVLPYTACTCTRGRTLDVRASVQQRGGARLTIVSRTAATVACVDATATSATTPGPPLWAPIQWSTWSRT